MVAWVVTDSSPSPEALVAGLVRLLDVEELDRDLYRGARLPGGTGRVFGGQVIAQALQAAQRSTEGKIAHSLHAYFMRPGDDALPILFRVERIFDGGSFATRRVSAMQRDTPILTMAASFQREEDGFHHQDAMPEVPAPETLPSQRELAAALPDTPRTAFFRRVGPIEIRPVDPANWLGAEACVPVNACWFRCVGPLGEDVALHRAVLSYASDLALLATSLQPHRVSLMTPGMQVASLDHAVWLHEPFRADEWLLYALDSPWAGHARGMSRGRIFTRDGRMIASAAQEGLIRMRGRMQGA